MICASFVSTVSQSSCLLNLNDLHEIGVSTDLLLDSMNGDNTITGLYESHLLGLLDSALDDMVGSLERGNLEGNHASADLQVSACGFTRR